MEKCLKKGKKIKYFFCVKQISMCDTYTYFYMNFLKAFKTIVFRFVALVTKKLWAILDFFSALYPIPYQKILLISILKSHKISR